MNKFKYLLTAGLMLGAGINVSAQVFEQDFYKKALWITTRFYGTQRSGAGHSWLIADHEPTNTSSVTNANLTAFVKGQDFVKDADGDYDLTGGWFDCGDHARFGQTEFYSAYMLALGYSEFPAGYDDYYSADYVGYRTAKDYTWAGKKGVPNGIPDILDEIKYATDFFKKCVRSSTEFYYQVGDGDADHQVWCTSPVKATLSNSQGGEKEGSRPVLKATGNATSVAALCGATLALMSTEYAPFDPAYAASCLEKAKVAYDFVMNTSKGNSGAGGYYPAKGKYEPDIVIFCMEMYRATGDETYKQKALENISFMEGSSTWNHNFSLCYNNTEDLAYYLLGMYANNELAKERLTYYVNDLYKPSSGYILNVKHDGWGVLRFPANQAFVLGLYDKMNDNLSTVNPYSLASIEYIMGSNSKKFSYIVGLTDNSPKHPHHRNYYGEDGNSEAVCNNFNKVVELGYMVGGSLDDGDYTDDEKSYTYSEGGIDYNAGLVSALGYINSIIAPINTNKFGHPTPSLGDDQTICGVESIVLESNVAADGKKTFTWDLDGTQLTSSTSATSYTATKAGKYTCTIDSAGEWQTSGSVNITSELPAINVASALTLCDPAQQTVDATIKANATYQWSKDGIAIDGATDPVYTITKAGTYTVTASATHCTSISADIDVTSKLPEVTDASSYSNGHVILSVSGDGDYVWYDAAEGGNQVGTGSTLSTKISQTTTFYVEDASSVAQVAGPTENDLTGTAVNWGNISASFTAVKPFLLKGISIYVQSVYNAGSEAATLVVSHNGVETEYKTDATNISSVGYYTFTISNPIEFETGSYTMYAKGNFAVGFFSTGKAYTTYQHDGEVITFTGATNGTATDYPFPGLVNWQVQAGTGCGRAAVVATYDANGPIDTHVETELSENNLNIYPNPVKETLNIDIEGNATVEFINALGKIVKTTSLVNGSNTINVSDLNAGIYAIRVKSANGVYVNRIIKK